MRCRARRRDRPNGCEDKEFASVNFHGSGSLPSGEQKLQCLRPAARPSRFRCAGRRRLRGTRGSRGETPFAAGSWLSGPGVVAACRRLPRCRRRGRAGRASARAVSTETQDLTTAEPDRRAHDQRAPEGRWPAEERVEADQATHRRAGDDGAVPILLGAIRGVDARLDRVDRESARSGRRRRRRASHRQTGCTRRVVRACCAARRRSPRCRAAPAS